MPLELFTPFLVSFITQKDFCRAPVENLVLAATWHPGPTVPDVGMGLARSRPLLKEEFAEPWQQHPPGTPTASSPSRYDPLPIDSPGVLSLLTRRV